ncbi:uncharacterized protein DUF4244 [Pseudonocardia hierapolitana]|uniref:Uncharacterized protein DUF4244 n=1 Tax=Pseudonocardia hierapolitana TaxID=1128676 RepID=A0A561SQ96_9PSEU|nr:DUF4244 domain-containing protein [Pseudonocardia hierapolitana]TWF77034.1 uncharacterized protein DUF4244 [Pseudonocardia hierapolitana]
MIQSHATRPVSTQLQSRLRRLVHDDRGMSTVEYAIGTVAAAAFGALLYTVVTGDSILTALTGLVERALTVTF